MGRCLTISQKERSRLSLLFQHKSHRFSSLYLVTYVTGLLLSIMFITTTAQAASCKIPKSYYKNVSCTASRGYFLAVKDFGEPVALINDKGKVVVDLMRYQKVDANKISDNLMPVLSKGRVGYINLQGREVIPAVYDMLGNGQEWARAASEGRIVVKKSGQYGVVSTGNQTIVPFSKAISNIDDYRGGVARVSKNKAITWLDKDGNVAADPNAPPPTRSSANKNGADKNTSFDNRIPARSTIKDKDLSPVIRNPSSSIGFTTLHAQQQGGKWGFVDNNDVVMITYSFDEVRPFSEELAGVRIDDNWGFLNLGGEMVIPLKFDNRSIIKSSTDSDAPFIFKNGKAWVSNLKNGGKICINKKGDYVGCDLN